ncbi:sensor histidine kinase [Nocardiopsis nanhaiensis]
MDGRPAGHGTEGDLLRTAGVFALVLVLTLVIGCAVLAWASAGGNTDALLLAVSAAAFAVLAGIHTVQVRRAIAAHRLVVSLSLLVLQAALAVGLLALGGWLWHGSTGLLASAALLVLPGRCGRWTAGAITAAVAPLAALMSLSWEQCLHWLSCHIVVVGIIWSLVFFARSMRTHARKVQRSERARFSSDIHDIMGRTITGITLQGQLLHQMSSGKPELQGEVRNLMTLARGARSEMRSAVAATWSTSLAEEFTRAEVILHDAAMDVSAEVQPCALPHDIDRALALTLREAVTNILVHSSATEVRLSLRRTGSAVTMTVRNDGAAEGPVEWGTGLAGIHERCREFQGGMSAGSTPRGAFTLTCRMRVA